MYIYYIYLYSLNLINDTLGYAVVDCSYFAKCEVKIWKQSDYFAWQSIDLENQHFNKALGRSGVIYPGCLN
jgi:hypothetical protein